jgi:hypothetical protein
MRGAAASYGLRQLQPQITQITQIEFRIRQLPLNPSRRERNPAGRLAPPEGAL